MEKSRNPKELDVDELHTLACTKAILQDTSDGVVFVVKTEDTKDGKSIKAEINFAIRNVTTEVLVAMQQKLQDVIDNKTTSTQDLDKNAIDFEALMAKLFGKK